MTRPMRIDRHSWMLLGWLAASLLAPGRAHAEEDPIKAEMRAALEAQVEERPAVPALPTQAAVLSPSRGRERARTSQFVAACWYPSI